jgi:flagellar biosynthesis protein FlhA
VGGFCIGVFDAGMTLAESAEVFTKLTIGDGLVSQVPAFLISLAAGLLVTRSSTDTNLPIEFIGQLFSRPQALAVTGGFLGLLIFTDLPTIPLFLIAAGCLALALKLRSQRQQVKAAQEAKARAQAPPAAEQRLEDLLHVDPMEVELGARLIRLADPKRGGQLMERIQGVRQQIAAELGIVLPKVRIRDNPGLDREQYRIKLSDVPVADGQLRPDLYLAIDLAQQGLKINGLKTTDPAFGAPAVWIDETQIDAAKMAGFVVAEPVSVLATHFQEVVRRHADEILTRDATKQLVEELKKTSPAVVEELVPKHMTLAEVQQVLQMLLREGVPIRQLATILETLGDFAARAAKDPVLLTEQVRFRLARAICSKYRDAEKRLFVVTLDPKLEDRLRAGIQHTERGLLINMSPQAIRSTCDQIAKELHKLQLRGLPPVILVSPQIRAGLKQLTQPHLPKLVVLSFNEITRDTVIESVGNVVEGAPA